MRKIVLSCLGVFLFGCTSFPNQEQEVRVYFEEALRQEELGNKEDAFEWYEQVVDLEPKHQEAQMRLGQMHFNRQEYQKAREKFLGILQQGDSKNPNLLYWIATTYFKEEQYLEALSLLEQIIEQSKKHFYTYRLAIQICILEPSLYEKGLKIASIGIEYYPGYAEFHRAKGEFLTRLQEEEKAIRAFEEAQKLDDLLIDFEEDLMFLYAKKGMYLETLKTWDRKIAKSYLWSEQNLQKKLFEDVYAQVDRYHNRYSKAYQKNETLDIKQLEDLFNLGVAFKNAGWTREAREIFQRILHADPQHSFALHEKKQIEKFTHFLEAYRRYFYQIYRQYDQHKSSPSILTVMKDIEKIAQLHKIEALQQKPMFLIETIMFVYNYVQLSHQNPSPLTSFFYSLNHYLLIFNFFGPVESNVKHILAWIPERKKRVWDKDYEYELFLCERSEVFHYKEKEVLSSFGGLCLTDRSFWLDIDTYRRIAVDVYKSFRRERLRGDFSDLGAEVLTVRYSSELQSQLAYQACNQLLDNFEGSPDAQKYRFLQKILEQLLEVAEYHELGHLCKHQEYLPPSLWEKLNPITWGSGLSLLITKGFSDKNIAIWSEEKAQLTALRHSNTPHLALYRTIGSMVKSPEVSRHSAGYHRIIQGYVHYIYEQPHLFPEIDISRNIMEQLYKLKPQEIRNIAEYLY